MGIDIHNLNLLAHAQDLGARFGRSLAIGRQVLFIEDFELERHRLLRRLAPLDEPAPMLGSPRYFEPLMRQWLGAQVIDSVDASPYEGATLIHDMNLPWQTGMAELGSYDAVLDYGCLEHVFNFPVAWRNCVDLCRVGGHILHSLPANNLSGHGFYQFSPEIFFNLYREHNGFELRGLWFALKADPRYWWKVADPLQVKRRVNLCNGHEVYMMVLARKLREVGPLLAPQQSDYVQDEWLKVPQHSVRGELVAPTAVPWDTQVRRLMARWGLIDTLRAARERLRAVRYSSLALPLPDYERVDVRHLLQRGG
jgi:SAM-dependent methyltransferase